MFTASGLLVLGEDKLFLRVGEAFDHVAEGSIVSEVAVLAVFRSCSALLNTESIANRNKVYSS
jgi:hypothetical protein